MTNKQELNKMRELLREFKGNKNRTISLINLYINRNRKNYALCGILESIKRELIGLRELLSEGE